VVLADAEHVEPDPVGQLDLLEQVLEPLRGLDPGPTSANVYAPISISRPPSDSNRDPLHYK